MVVSSDAPAPSRPPGWLIVATCLLAALSLVMAVAETSLWTHYLIDAGEYISLAGLAFILVAGLYLYRRRTLAASLPLAIPWLLLPVITQGDQIIDNLSINWMRLISHVLLGFLFGAPVAVVALIARPLLAPGARTSLVLLLLLGEMWIAVQFLGLLMVLTLVVMMAGVVVHGWRRRRRPASMPPAGTPSEQWAVALLVAAVAASFALYLGFKNRPGAYQGSPAYYMDPGRDAAGFELDRVPVPPRAASLPADADAVRSALTAYARALERLLAGYYILDRNYNYDFHNRLFLRRTPLLPDYRAAGLAKVREASGLRAHADRLAAAVRPTLAVDDPLGELFDDMRAYAEFTFERAPVLERMSAGFERTEAGLQHATHLYEGEGKMLSERFASILEKHRGVLETPAVEPVTAEFARIGRSVHATYANRIVGF